MTEHTARRLAEAILSWHDEYARPLPWLNEKDPYRVWLSEIMLQQTRAETVIPYYERFLIAFPDVNALAAAGDEAVLKQWEGLGYYSRARNLLRAARVIAGEYEGRFPEKIEEIRALPGIGEYTAGAIASIAFGAKEPAIDGNQIRVLSRLFGILEDARSPEGKRRLRAGAEALLPEDRPGDFNQALMGLGAMVCLPRNPKCESCPANAFCEAFATGAQAAYPAQPPKAKKKTVQVAVALVFNENRIFVRRRRDGGLLAGMWEFPCFEGACSKEAVAEALGEIGVTARRIVRAEESEHVFTHRVWKMTGWLCEGEAVRETEQGRYVDAEALETLPMGAAIRLYRERAMALLRAKQEG